MNTSSPQSASHSEGLARDHARPQRSGASFSATPIWLAFIACYSLPFLATINALPGASRHLNDIFSGLLLAQIVLVTLATRRFLVPGKYVFLFVTLLLLVICSAVASAQSIGSLLLGIKTYFVYVPFFLAAIVIPYRYDQIHRLLLGFAVLALIQLPLAFYQRFILFGDRMHTGDYIVGTMGISSFLSIFLMLCLTVATAFYLARKLSLASYLTFAVCMMLPTTINETKGTLIMLPLAIGVPFLIHAITTRQYGKLAGAALFGTAAMAAFIFSFNQIEQKAHDRTLGERNLLEYTFQGKDLEARSSESPVAGIRALNETREVGRGDSALIAWQVLWSEGYENLIFGKGLGAVTEINIKFLQGVRSNYEHLKPTYTVITRLLWEVGLAGIVIVFTLLGMILFDVAKISRSELRSATLALGWLGVLAIITFSMVYKDLVFGKVLSSFFWFFSGYLVSQRLRGHLSDYESVDN